jgi:hypothetical protein
MAVALVRKIETGLECGQWLLRKLKLTVTGAKLLHVYSVSLFSRQPSTPFESSFDFPDQLNQPKLVQRPKKFCRANLQRRFSRLLTSFQTPAGTQYFSILLANMESIPSSSPVLIFWTNATPLITGKGRKCSAAQIGDSKFELPLNRLSRPPQSLRLESRKSQQRLNLFDLYFVFPDQSIIIEGSD